MKVNHTTIFIGESARRERHGEWQAEEKKSGSTVFAGNLNKDLDPIAQKRKQARQQAMKIVGDAFDGDRKIDDDLQARRDKIAKLQKENGWDRKALKALEEERAALREKYGVEEDSLEEQDLKLLAKEIDAKTPGKSVHLTLEESERIEEIKKNGLTEYQTRSLEKKEAGSYYEKLIYERDREIETENAIIRGTKLERLKKNPMVNAQKQADAVIEAASQEIIGMLTEEAKEHIDEEMEEKKEAAEKETQEKEKLEERLEKIKEKKKEQEELTEDILKTTEELTQLDSNKSEVQQDIRDLMNKMKLLEEDIKGAAVDENV